MGIISTIILSIGISMDSLAIALTSGAIIGTYTKYDVLKIAGMLAFVQMLLTIVGWFIGATFAHMIDQYDHWIAFFILFVLGLKMILEGIKNRRNNEDRIPFNPLNIKVMFSLALAASIDALAVGLSLSLLGKPILTISIIIGLVTLAMGIIGFLIGGRIGRKFNICLISVLGGVILIGIGTVILLEHTILASSEMAVIGL